MRKFKFRLETLLKVKEIKKKQIQSSMREIYSTLTQQTDFLNRIQREQGGLVEQMKGAALEGARVSVLHAYSQYIWKLQKRIEEQKRLIEKTKEELDLVRKELIRLSKEEKMLKKLKENQYTLFCRELAKQEEKRIDEVAAHKFSLDGDLYG